MKKIVSIFIIVLSLFYGSSVFAAENGDTTTTIVTYVVPESFKWTAPTDVTFDAADEIKTSTLVVSENIIPYNSFLIISIPEQEFVLTSSEGATRNYKVYLGENELTVGSEVLRIPAGTKEGSVDLNFKVPQVEGIKAGTYTGTLNFTAKVTGDYGITYYLDGGTNNPSNPSGYKMNEGDVTILEPTKLGYTFAGWYDNAEFTGSPITKIANGTSGNVNLYAKWTADEFVISYNLNGGTNDSSNPAKYNINSGAIVLRSPSKPGYTFVGWTGSNGETPQTSVTISAGSTGNKTYTANWTPNNYTYNIVYKSSSGKQLGTDTVTKDFGTTNTIGPVSFTGYTSPSSQSVVWDSVDAKTITFVYEPISYTITWNLDGGSLSGQKTSYTIEDSDYTLPTPTKEGYTFVAWNDGTNDVTGIVAGTTGTVSLTARWEKNVTIISFTIKFNRFSKTYEAEEGMTWEEWVNSKYCNDNGWVNNGAIYLNTDASGKIYKLSGQNPTDTIVDGTNYSATAAVN